MNRSKSAAVLLLLGAFAVGGATGYLVKSGAKDRDEKDMRRQMYEELNLSEHQRALWDSIIDARSKAIAAVNATVKPSLDSINATVRPTKDSIWAAARQKQVDLMTAEQRVKWDEMLKEYRRNNSDNQRQKQQQQKDKKKDSTPR